MERERVRVILDLQRDGVPIRGSVSVADGGRRHFHGWLELADALEAARAGTLASEAIAHDLETPLSGRS